MRVGTDKKKKNGEKRLGVLAELPSLLSVYFHCDITSPICPPPAIKRERDREVEVDRKTWLPVI